MLFWLFVILTAVFIAMTVISNIYDIFWFDVLGGTFTIVVGIVTLIMLICIVADHTTVDATINKYNTRYDMLVYQYENDIYDNDNDVGKRDLMTDIQSWNEDLAYRKSVQRNFWLGIFYPNIYDQFECIDYSNYKRE